jgi:APA family basic amino acid/polyamine antiporter
MAVYFVINMAYLWVLPASEMMTISSPAAAVAMAIFGPVGGTLIKVGIIISVIGAANGFLMSGSRVAFHLADTNTLPASKTLAKLNGNLVPANSIILIGFLACLYSLIGQFNLLTDLAVFSCWIFYTLTFYCVIVLRKKMPDAERKYKVPCYPVIPIIAIASGMMFLVNSSSGGTDIIALIVKKFSGIRIGRALLITDVTIVLVGGCLSGWTIFASSLIGLLIKTLGIDVIIYLILWVARKRKMASE